MEKSYEEEDELEENGTETREDNATDSVDLESDVTSVKTIPTNNYKKDQRRKNNPQMKMIKQI